MKFLYFPLIVLLLPLLSCERKYFGDKTKNTKKNILQMLFQEKEEMYLFSIPKYKGKADDNIAKITYYQTTYPNEVRDKCKRLDSIWRIIIQKKDTIVPYLLRLEKDTSFSLYGGAFDDDNDGIPSARRLANKFHALYLLECILRNDFLFNRRTTIPIVRKIFEEDASNYLVNKDFVYKERKDFIHRLPSLKEHYSSNTDLEEAYDKAWQEYRACWNDGKFKKRKPDLRKLGLKWHSLNMFYENEAEAYPFDEIDKFFSWQAKLKVGNGVTE